MYLNLAECDSQKDKPYTHPIPEDIPCSNGKPLKADSTCSSGIVLLSGKCMGLVK